MKLIETILAKMPGIAKPQKKFIAIVLGTLMHVQGKVNFRNRGFDIENTIRRARGKELKVDISKSLLFSKGLSTVDEKTKKSKNIMQKEEKRVFYGKKGE